MNGRGTVGDLGHEWPDLSWNRGIGALLSWQWGLEALYRFRE
jgi:hypothetical protein